MLTMSQSYYQGRFQLASLVYKIHRIVSKLLYYQLESIEEIALYWEMNG